MNLKSRVTEEMTTIDRDVEIQKSLDYASVFADGIILKLEDETARLIFYEKILEPTEDGKSLDTKKNILRLKHEVRISQTALEGFAIHAKKLMDIRAMLVRLAAKSKSAKGVPSAWGKVDSKLQSGLYNTDDYDLGKPSVDNFATDLEDLIMRIARDQNIDPEILEEALKQNKNIQDKEKSET